MAGVVPFDLQWHCRAAERHVRCGKRDEDSAAWQRYAAARELGQIDVVAASRNVSLPASLQFRTGIVTGVWADTADENRAIRENASGSSRWRDGGLSNTT